MPFSPDRQQLASEDIVNVINLWDLTTEMISQSFQGHEQYVSSHDYLPDGKHLVSGSFDNTVRLWDPTTGKDLKLFKLGS